MRGDGLRLGPLVVAIVLLSIAAYAVAAPNPGALLASLPLTLLGWWLTERKGGSPLPRPLIGAVLVGVVAYAVLTTMGRADLADLGVFIVAVLVVKAFDRKRAADIKQMLILSIFLVVGAVLLSNSLALGAILLILMPLLVLTAIRFQVFAGYERQRDAYKGAGLPEPGLRLPKRAGRHLTGISLLALAMVVSAGVLVFVAMPRGLGAEAFGRWGGFSVGQTIGFTDRVQLGAPGRLAESTVPVLDLRLEDEGGNPVGRAGEVYYLRGAVLNEYNTERGAWEPGRSEQARTDPDDRPGGQPYRFFGYEGSSLRQIITIRNMRSELSYLFSVWQPVSITFEQRANLIHAPRELVLLRSGPSGRVRYTVDSVVNPTIARPRVPRDDVEPWPGPIQEYTERLLRNREIEPDRDKRPYERDLAAIRAIEGYLQSEFEYTLDLSAAPSDQDATEWFLLDERKGHCEYFASAMVAMCRSVGIESRVVTGFVAVEFNPASGAYTVRRSNAHAWVEARIGAEGVWRRFDPTPPSDLLDIHMPDEGAISRISRVMDAIEHAWLNSIVGFDEGARSRFLGRSDDEQRSHSPGPLEGLLERIGEEGLAGVLRALAGATMALVGLFVGVIGLAAAWRAIRRWLIGRRRWTGRERSDTARLLQEAGFYRELLRLLRKRGVAKPRSRPPGRHASWLAERQIPFASDVARLSSLFYAVRFGGRPLTTAEREEVELCLSRIRAAEKVR